MHTSVSTTVLLVGNLLDGERNFVERDVNAKVLRRRRLLRFEIRPVKRRKDIRT